MPGEKDTVMTGLLIKGGDLYEHDGDVHWPRVADVLIEGGTIAAVGKDLAPSGPHDVIDAAGRLVLPGLINAHYHSHDTLCRGLFEELPLEMWLLYTLPMGRNRSKEEVRARTLVGALESLRAGITTVQDMLNLTPLNDEYTEVVLGAYRDAGIRVVIAPMVADIPAIGLVRGGTALPDDVQQMIGTTTLPAREQLAYLEHQYARDLGSDVLHWAVAPFAPQRCTPKLLEACAELAERFDLPVYTHVYETKGQVLIARELFKEHEQSLIVYLKNTGLLGPRLNIVHGVWTSRRDMERLAEADCGLVLNHLSNMKLKSGIAPVRDLIEAGVRLGLGCDNCSASDVQNVFQAMKMFCLIAAVSEPEPGTPLSHEALKLATRGNARTAGLEGRIGELKPGYSADIVLIDLKDTAYLPYNSAARQLVYSETGRGVETVIVNGRVVIRDRKALSIDEDGLRREVRSLMRHFMADYDAVAEAGKRALPSLLEAHRKVWQEDIGMSRFISRTR
jgi:cytosine/adenosine deaminase-related metal-dependent hydrolase